MADALCGPSNPLQNIQKHASVDRSLQQDRLISRHGQGHAQGFRSQAHGNPGLLDHEFEAFQAGVPMLDIQQQHQLMRQNQIQQTHQMRHTQAQPRQAAGGWASDFAKLNISSPSPAASFQHPGPQQAAPSWHEDFGAMMQQNLSPAMAQSHFQQQSSFGGPMSSFNAQRPVGYMPSQSLGESSEERWKGKGRWQAEEVHDQAAFEREFEALATEALRSVEPESETTELGQDTRVSGEQQDRYLGVNELGKEDQSISERDYASEPLQQEPIDVIPQHMREAVEEQTQARDRPETDEDLAHTAGILLESVSDNTSKKFQDSNFLQLMRQLRDHEVRVDGDKIVNVDPGVDVRIQPHEHRTVND